MFRKCLLFCFAVWWAGVLLGQADCSFGLRVQSTAAQPDDMVTLPVTAHNFTEVIGLQYNHSWDPTQLQFLGVTYNPQVPWILENHFNLTPEVVAGGHLNFAFLDNTLQGVTLPDDQPLYSLRFIYLGGDAVVTTDGSQVPIEIIVDDDEALGEYYFLHAHVNPGLQEPPQILAAIAPQACNNPNLGQIELSMSGVMPFSYQ
ncbi:MAG: cohesin domain-containing protein [Saprospiraceae bacterium]